MAAVVNLPVGHHGPHVNPPVAAQARRPRWVLVGVLVVAAFGLGLVVQVDDLLAGLAHS